MFSLYLVPVEPIHSSQQNIKMNRGGGKMLRPGGNQPFFDDSSDDSDSDEEEEVQDAPPSRPTTNLSSDEDDDDSDDDDDDDDDLGASNKRSRSFDDDRKTKKSRPSFFDEEAEDADDDEDEEVAYGTHHDPHDRVKRHYTEDDIRRENMDEDALAIINRQNRRRNQIASFNPDDDIEDVARQIEERHRLASRRVDRTVLDDADIANGNQSLAAVTQQSLLPSVSDPNLWMFGCANGKEKELVYQIMNKCIAFARQGKPLGITSAVAAQSKGRIYIESYSEPAVREAIQGVRGLMAYSMRMVPLNDMTTVMTVTAKKKPGKLRI